MNNKIRTLQTKNEIKYHDTYAEIILYNQKNIPVGNTKVDLEDIPFVSNLKWFKLNNGYVYNGKLQILLHRLITNVPPNLEIDHINFDKLDNRKSNLRAVTRSQNNQHNIRKGIGFKTCNNKWRARIGYNGKNIFLGYFDTEEEALRIRQKAKNEYYGEYA